MSPETLALVKCARDAAEEARIELRTALRAVEMEYEAAAEEAGWAWDAYNATPSDTTEAAARAAEAEKMRLSDALADLEAGDVDSLRSIVERERRAGVV